MLGDTPDDVEAVVLTHGHFDHLGFAERARTELGVPVWVHENDVPLTRRPRQYGHEQRRVYYFATQFRALPMVAAFVRNRAWWPTPVKDVQRYEREILRVPGALRTIPTSGHTLGHCALHLPDRDTVIAGDAIVTLNPYTGSQRPTDRLRSRDSRQPARAVIARRTREDRRQHSPRRSRPTMDRRSRTGGCRGARGRRLLNGHPQTVAGLGVSS